MQRKNQKHVAFMAFMHEQEGFTLISSLLRIFIITITLPVLIVILAKFTVDSAEESLSIQQLFFILQNEFNLADEVDYTKTRVYLRINSSLIIFERYGNQLRRTVHREGHVIYHRNIQSFNVERLPYGIKLKITMLSGDQYERILLSNDQ